jgi:hypothetical protein
MGMAVRAYMKSLSLHSTQVYTGCLPDALRGGGGRPLRVTHLLDIGVLTFRVRFCLPRPGHILMGLNLCPGALSSSGCGASRFNLRHLEIPKCLARRTVANNNE